MYVKVVYDNFNNKRRYDIFFMIRELQVWDWGTSPSCAPQCTQCRYALCSEDVLNGVVKCF